MNPYESPWMDDDLRMLREAVSRFDSASTFDVAAIPTMALARAMAIAASVPCVRRNAKSTRSWPSAASTYRAAFDASVVCSVIWFSR